MVFVNEGKIPVQVFFWVAPTFYDAVAAGVLADDLVFGEGDAEACIAKRANADEGPGEVVHDMAVAGGRRYVLVVELGGGGGGQLGTVGDLHLDVGGGGVVVGDGGSFAEVEAGGARVDDTNVGLGQGGASVGGWAAGQGDSVGHSRHGFQ